MDKFISTFDAGIVRRLARVHPLDLPTLRSHFLRVLTSTTGIAPAHPVFASLSTARCLQEFERIDWPGIGEQIWTDTHLSATTCTSIVEHVRLFALRAAQHERLFLAKSLTTLQVLGQYPYFLAVPPSLQPLYAACMQTQEEADRALHTGRANLQEFGRLALRGAALSRLPGLLEQSAVCYAHYCQALDRGDELAFYIKWYIAWESGVGKESGRCTSQAA